MQELQIDNHGAVRVLRMNRPEKRNALNNALTQALVAALAEAERDEGVHCVVLTGNGSAFCAGADIGEFKDLTSDQMERVERRADLTMQLHLSISRMSKPVIAAINGFAMGGGAGLAIACDLALAARSARIGYPEVRHGIVAAIVLPNLTRQVGRKVAFELVATGEAVDANRALQLGLLNAVHADDDLMRESLALAERLASFSRPAMSTTKQTFHRVVDLPLAEGLEVGRDANKRMRSFISINEPATMKPLEHITILDLSRVLACPFASMILAELGATVIKVEQPGSGDETHSFEPHVHADGGSESAYYMAFNRSKQSITINLRSPEGQQLVRDLATDVDVVIENFPVSTLTRYGLGADALRALNPRLVYLSCTGFGQTGPYAPRKGYDTVFQAMGGIMSLTGEPGGGPVKPGLPVADLSSGLWAAIAVLSALQGRTVSGKGCHIDLSMFDAQVSMLTLAAARWFALQEVPPRMGTEHPGRVPSASFQGSDGRWLHITASDQHWKPLCEALDLAVWGADAGLDTNAGRVRRREEVMVRLSAAIATHDRDSLCAKLDAASVPAGPIYAVDEVLADRHVVARGMVASFQHPSIGEFPALPVPLKFDGWDNPTVDRPPLLGEHTAQVLQQRLGIDEQRLAALRELRAI